MDDSKADTLLTGVILVNPLSDGEVQFVSGCEGDRPQYYKPFSDLGGLPSFFTDLTGTSLLEKSLTSLFSIPHMNHIYVLYKEQEEKGEEEEEEEENGEAKEKEKEREKEKEKEQTKREPQAKGTDKLPIRQHIDHLLDITFKNKKKILKKITVTVLELNQSVRNICDALRDFYTRFRISETFVLVLGDAIVDSEGTMEEMVNCHAARKDASQIMTVHLLRSHPLCELRGGGELGVYAYDESTGLLLGYGRMDDFFVKMLWHPTGRGRSAGLACDLRQTGVYVCSPNTLLKLAEEFDLSSLTDVFLLLTVNDDLRLANVYAHIQETGEACRIRDPRIYLNYLQNKNGRAIRGVADSDVSPSVNFEAPVNVADATKIASDSFVSKSFISQGTRVGKKVCMEESVIGENGRIGDNVTISHSILESDVTVENGSQIKDCFITRGAAILAKARHNAVVLTDDKENSGGSKYGSLTSRYCSLSAVETARSEDWRYEFLRIQIGQENYASDSEASDSEPILSISHQGPEPFELEILAMIEEAVEVMSESVAYKVLEMRSLRLACNKKETDVILVVLRFILSKVFKDIHGGSSSILEDLKSKCLEMVQHVGLLEVWESFYTEAQQVPETHNVIFDELYQFCLKNRAKVTPHSVGDIFCYLCELLDGEEFFDAEDLIRWYPESEHDLPELKNSKRFLAYLEWHKNG